MKKELQLPGDKWPHWTPSDMTWAESEWWHEKVAVLIADGIDEIVAENRVLHWYYQQHPGKPIVPCLLKLKEVSA